MAIFAQLLVHLPIPRVGDRQWHLSWLLLANSCPLRMRNELLLWLQVDRADRVVAVRGGFEYKSENDIINY